ncbi:MAG: hypothetical protein A2X11_00740 [Bacteroidetes bacterium GWE2_42_24]|nr:MAG: hypothetical protein A2X11_00740 [Bacteroidetes bacterium GWE2_42_24]OFY27507.1 MAG: hypothetical protein A2X09_07485 [Bacteroidetes bacterium GWF2_43_11]
MTLLVLGTVLMGTGSMQAQGKDIIPVIEKALTAGNSQLISTYFADHVNLSLPGTDGVYSKEQAGAILKEFFTRHKPTQFKVTHKGKSGEGASYFVGTLTCGAKKFSLYVLLHKTANNSTIKQFQVEED